MSNEVKWKLRARQGKLGPRVDLTTLEGFWIKAKKHGVEELAAIRKLEKLAPALVRKLGALRPDERDELKTPEFQRKVLAALNDEEFEQLQRAQDSMEPELVASRLLYGIGLHNLGQEGPEVESDKVTKDFVHELIVELPTETIKEMLDAIREVNPGPLAEER